jgi:hypothetical protein
MTIIFSGLQSAITIVYDREFGFLKEVQVAPTPRSTLVIGKCLGGSFQFNRAGSDGAHLCSVCFGCAQSFECPGNAGHNVYHGIGTFIARRSDRYVDQRLREFWDDPEFYHIAVIHVLWGDFPHQVTA